MAEEVLEYWIWLQQALGAGSPKPISLVKEFGSVGEVYRARRIDYLRTGLLNEKEIRRMTNKSLEKSEKIVCDCMKNGYKILTPENMPPKLQNIYNPPCALYVWGEFPQPCDGVYIAMVGTRKATPYGIEAATKLALGLARCGAVVVSGMAVGVDSASHKGALKGGGKTVSVIGCGIDIDYPSGHRELKRIIAGNGAVVSEYPPGARPERANFPIRNRIIAGLSLGCVVIEAGEKSGSLITASLAAEMGRDVFAVPGSIFSPLSAGTNKLLRDGVKPVCRVMDILEEYISFCPQNVISRILGSNSTRGDNESGETGELPFVTVDDPKGEAVEKPDAVPPRQTDGTVCAPGINDAQTGIRSVSHGSEGEKTVKNANSVNSNISTGDAVPENGTCADNADKTAGRRAVSTASVHDSPVSGLSEKQAAVYNVLSDKPMHVDEIALKANMEPRTLLAVLTTLEIEGYARSLPGRRYILIR